MADFNEIGTKMQELFGEIAQTIAIETGFRQRVSKLGGAEVAEALIAGWLVNPQASRSELAQLVGVTKQAIDQVLSEKGALFLEKLLEKLVEQVISSEPTSLKLLKRFNRVLVLDSSVITLPAALKEKWQGCGKAASPSEAGLKLHVMLDLVSGTLYGPALTAARTHDRAGPHQNWQLAKGDLRIGDLGYFSLGRLQETKAEQAYFLSKVQTGVRIYNQEKAKYQALSEWLGQQDQTTVDCEVKLGVRKNLECRLIAWQVPNEVVEKRQHKVTDEARRRQQAVSAEQQSLTYWTVYITNLPQTHLSPAEVAVLYRLRWQIELLFKLWKSLGEIDEWCSEKPWAILAELYAKLIGQVVQHWLSLVGSWAEPERSLIKVSRVVKSRLAGLMAHLRQGQGLVAEIALLAQDLSQGCKLERRKKRPSSFQLSIAPPDLNHLI